MQEIYSYILSVAVPLRACKHSWVRCLNVIDRKHHFILFCFKAKIKLGVQRVRPWRWTPFVNPARKDGLVLNHWRRVADEGKEYPFARFNKEVEVPSYSDVEYAQVKNNVIRLTSRASADIRRRHRERRID